jgi:hypothetical protein
MKTTIKQWMGERGRRMTVAAMKDKQHLLPTSTDDGGWQIVVGGGG